MPLHDHLRHVVLRYCTFQQEIFRFMRSEGLETIAQVRLLSRLAFLHRTYGMRRELRMDIMRMHLECVSPGRFLQGSLRHGCGSRPL